MIVDFDSMGYNEDDMNAYGFFQGLNLFHQNTEKPGYDIWGMIQRGLTVLVLIVICMIGMVLMLILGKLLYSIV